VAAAIGSERVARVLARLSAEAAELDPPGKSRMAARETQLGRRIYGQEAVELYGDAHLSITREVGELLYVLVRGAGARTVVEFGSSVGFSTIYLAAAVHDSGGGLVISTELSPDKQRRARENLAEAGLAEHVELRGGDARATLADLATRVDLLFLDGWNDLYIEILLLLERSLGERALVAADMSAGDPHHERYRAHVFDPASGFASVEVPLDSGVVLSVRTEPIAPSAAGG
jgi:predicted O-methyltransferase YrrM